MTRDQAEALLDLIISRAPKLRSAGVLGVSVGETSFRLAPAEQPEADDMQIEEDDDVDILDDPWTYGRKKPRGKRKDIRT